MRKGKGLEQYIAEKLKVIDQYSRPTKASGASTEIGDILNKHFFVECKERNTVNLGFTRATWYKLLGQIPVDSQKGAFLALQNKFKDRFIVMDAEEFFNLLYSYFEAKSCR